MYIVITLIQNSGGKWIVKKCDENIQSALKLADDMIELADRGDAHRKDTGCGILFGIIRDSAYKIKKNAETEKKAHIKKGWWK